MGQATPFLPQTLYLQELSSQGSPAAPCRNSAPSHSRTLPLPLRINKTTRDSFQHLRALYILHHHQRHPPRIAIGKAQVPHQAGHRVGPPANRPVGLQACPLVSQAVKSPFPLLHNLQLEEKDVPAKPATFSLPHPDVPANPLRSTLRRGMEATSST